MPRKYTPQERIDAFWSYVNKDGSTPEHCPELGQCWEWTGHKMNKQGYGGFRIGKQMTAHRVSWLLTYGSLPEELDVLHSCDNTACVNPNHLFLGTHTDNMRDRKKKGRGNHPKGEKAGLHKLTENEVREIRQRYAQGGITGYDLAIVYSVYPTTIYKILSRQTWKHID